ncbi:MAG: hypothetical protein ACRC0X_09300 [Brevinema sp.]
MIQTIPNRRLEQQIGYHKWLSAEFQKESEALQSTYYSKGKKPTDSQLKKLQKVEYMANYYYEQIKERIAELKRRRDAGIFIEEM